MELRHKNPALAVLLLSLAARGADLELMGSDAAIYLGSQPGRAKLTATCDATPPSLLGIWPPAMSGADITSENASVSLRLASVLQTCTNVANLQESPCFPDSAHIPSLFFCRLSGAGATPYTSPPLRPRREIDSEGGVVLGVRILLECPLPSVDALLAAAVTTFAPAISVNVSVAYGEAHAPSWPFTGAIDGNVLSLSHLPAPAPPMSPPAPPTPPPPTPLAPPAPPAPPTSPPPFSPVSDSCQSHLDSGATTSGEYLILPPGDDSFGGQPISVYCDMSFDSGGWTLVAKKSSSFYMGTDSDVNVPILSGFEPPDSNANYKLSTIRAILASSSRKELVLTSPDAPGRTVHGETHDGRWKGAFKISMKGDLAELNWGSWSAVNYWCYNWDVQDWKTPHHGWYNAPSCYTYTGPQDMDGAAGNCGGSGSRRCGVDWGYGGVTGGGSDGTSTAYLMGRHQNAGLRFMTIWAR